MKLPISLLLFLLCLPGITCAQNVLLAGTNNGLFRIEQSQAIPLWDKADVRKIIYTEKGWYFLTGAGIVFSADLVTFEDRNTTLPIKVIKHVGNGEKKFTREVQELKDLEVHPTNPDVLVTATKDAVYLTRDAGKTWKNIGLNSITAGAKAVTVLDLPDSTGKMQLTILLSHPIYGVSWRQVDASSSVWVDMNDGLYKVPSIKWPDEVADFALRSKGDTIELFASLTFMPRLYKLDWAAKKFVQQWSGPAFIDTVDGLAVTSNSILFSSPGSIREILYPLSSTEARPVADWNGYFTSVKGNLLCAWIPESRSLGRGSLSLSELWLLKPAIRSGAYTTQANQKKGNYLPVHQVITDEGYNAHLKILKNNKLNMLVVDMKDDIGQIRYNSKDPLVLEKGKVRSAIDVESFVKKAKENGIYLVARIVVFKDKSLAMYGRSRYAVWDKTEGKSWQGYQMITQKTQAAEGKEPLTEYVRKNIEEYWVDPYSEDVWEYNVAISKELIARGFDEIQFDYIRFPTDGDNLDNASYRWKDAGMDKESALMSFLSYARASISAPISIDIYGANGWYRTGARTGQDVELLARYVDVICPMFYPSHFEQTFLAQPPAQERPYRIFYYGSYRNSIIARNHVIVRPWVQAFYLNVSYDRTYYNSDYVQRQVFGARDSIYQGYTYWNNSGRYDDLRPDVDILTPYPWQAPEAAFAGIRPVFGGQTKE